MENETAVEWFFDKIKSHFENDGDLYESLIFTFSIAKIKEKKQLRDFFYEGDSYSCSCYDSPTDEDFEEYYNQKFNQHGKSTNN